LIHLRDAPALRRAGAGVVAAGEAEVGVALAGAVTAADQMTCGDAADHRQAIRRSLYDGTPDLTRSDELQPYARNVIQTAGSGLRR